MEIVDRLSVLGGVARSRDFVRGRPDRRDLERAIELGAVEPLGAGWYAIAGTDRALAVATRFGAVVTCVSAAKFYDLPVARADSRLHLSIGGGRGRPPAAVGRAYVVHRQKLGGAAPGSRAPLAAVADALALALVCADELTALGMVDAARQRGLASTEEIAALLRGPGAVAARERLARSSARCRSVGETAARLALREAGLDVEDGVQIPGVGEVDLVVERCLVVECDGSTYHSDAASFAEDRRRDRAALAAGYVVVRFTHRHVVGDTAGMVEEVLEMLDRIRAGVIAAMRHDPGELGEKAPVGGRNAARRARKR